jgi:hypothetical protein
MCSCASVADKKWSLPIENRVLYLAECTHPPLPLHLRCKHFCPSIHSRHNPWYHTSVIQNYRGFIWNWDSSKPSQSLACSAFGTLCETLDRITA